MSRERQTRSLQVRAVLVSFDSAARTLTLIGDERALRVAFDRARMLLESLSATAASAPETRAELLDAGDRLLRSYRHHLERCETDYVASDLTGDQA